MRLQAEHLRFSYPRSAHAVNDVSLEISGPELLTIVGPNGSGKSTLLKLLARILRPAAGTLSLEGRAVESWPARDYAKRVGYLAQEVDLPFPMRAIEVVLSGRAPYLSRFQWEGEADRAAAEDALRMCDVSHLADRPLAEMSGGEKKRVFLARVLAAEPQIILLDEPLASLDMGHVEALAALMRQQVEGGRSVVFVAHDFNWAAAMSDRVAVMSQGSLVALGAPREVLTSELIQRVFGIATETLRGSDGVQWIVPALGRTR